MTCSQLPSPLSNHPQMTNIQSNQKPQFREHSKITKYTLNTIMVQAEEQTNKYKLPSIIHEWRTSYHTNYKLWAEIKKSECWKNSWTPVNLAPLSMTMSGCVSLVNSESKMSKQNLTYHSQMQRPTSKCLLEIISMELLHDLWCHPANMWGICCN
jgi:hypothetical protein